MARIKTRYVGVYYRYPTKERYCADGKLDKCYDITYTENGKVVFEKIGWRSEGYSIEKAIELRGVRIQKIRHPELSGEDLPQKSVILDDIWDIFEKEWLPGLKRGENVRSSYLSHIRPHFGSKNVLAITPLDIEKFRQELLKTKSHRTSRHLQPGTVRKILADFRRILNKAREWKIIPANDMSLKIAVPPVNSRRERYLKPSEAESLLERLKSISLAYYFIAKISLYTGMRLGEILNLRGQDIDLLAGTICIMDGKTGRRAAYMPDELKIELPGILPACAGDFLFPSPKTGKQRRCSVISTSFSRIFTKMGLNDGVTEGSHRVVFHTLRHTFASWLAMKGVTLYTIGELLGHKSIQMTQRYAKLSPDSKRDALKLIGNTMSSIENPPVDTPCVSS